MPHVEHVAHHGPHRRMEVIPDTCFAGPAPLSHGSMVAILHSEKLTHFSMAITGGLPFTSLGGRKATLDTFPKDTSI